MIPVICKEGKNSYPQKMLLRFLDTLLFLPTPIYSHPPPKYWVEFHIFNQNWTSLKLVIMTLGDKLRQLREENQMAQRQVGAVIEVDGAFISKVENNEKPIKRDHLKTLAKLFKVKEVELQTLWLADKVRNILNEEPQANEVIRLLETDFK